DQSAMDLALELTLWSRDLTLFTNGAELELDLLQKAEKRAITVVKEPIASLDGDENELQALRMKNGELVPVQKLFFFPSQGQHESLAGQLGCKEDSNGPGVECDISGKSSIEGVY